MANLRHKLSWAFVCVVAALIVAALQVEPDATVWAQAASGDIDTPTCVLTASAPSCDLSQPPAAWTAPPSHNDPVPLGPPNTTNRGAVQSSTDAQGVYTLTQRMDFVDEPPYTRYLPLLQRPPADLSIRHIEVTQAIQTESNRVPLVAGRPTVARVYATTNDWEEIPGIFLELTATRYGQFLGAVRQGPGFVRPVPARALYETTYNVRLPASWLAQDVELHARIDPNNDYAELDEDNNDYWLPLSFQPTPVLQIKFIPINYTHLPTGAYFPGVWNARELDFLQQAFPVSQVEMTVRAPLDFRGDLTRPEQWPALLSAVAELKLADGAAAAQVYYGLIPLRHGDDVRVVYGGMGFLSFRAAIGLVDQPQTTAHEIGHNLGLRHAPCGNPAFVDPDYPYGDGQIGEYGVDVAGDRLLSATDYKDLMGYCGPRWISDYHYLKLLHDLQQQGRLSAPPVDDGWLLRLRFAANGAAELLPNYPLRAPLSAPGADNSVQVQFLDAHGAVLASYPVQLLTAEEGALALQLIAAIVPAPPTAATQVQVTAAGTVLAVRPLAPAALDPLVADAARGRLTWSGRDRPVLVRYSADQGATWTTLAIDHSGDRLTLPQDLAADGLLWEVVAGR